MDDFKLRNANPISFTSFQSPSTISHASNSDYFTQSTYSSTRINDPKTQLLQRWHSLAQQISQAQIPWDAVIALDRNLDRVEDMLSHKAPLDDCLWSPGESNHGLGIFQMKDSGVDVGFESETTPPASNAPRDVTLLKVGSNNQVDNSALLERITNAVKQLRERQQEVKHFHKIAASKIEEENENIVHLKSQMSQLEQDITDDETELTYLKLQLRIIEIQTLPYVPKNDHDDLALGIQRWKLDWADVDERYRKRRWKRELDKKQGLEPGLSSSTDEGLEKIEATR